VIPQTRVSLAADCERDGFSILPAIFADEEVASLIEAISEISAERALRSRRGIYAIRNLLELSQPMRHLADSQRVRALVEPHLGADLFPTRGTLFDKIAGANWLVPWHQDLTICVAQRIDVRLLVEEGRGLPRPAAGSGVAEHADRTFTLTIAKNRMAPCACFPARTNWAV
jgi:hypothetical protein